ncbi:MAG TPA: hypothetical protein VJK02_11555 [Anaerolineales bacterium]|jgi:hypothetical protein|nr:hypothetical protein [Anaerolineales bacterium]
MDPTQDTHRELAKQANSRAWLLLRKAERSPAEDAELVEAAYASLYHWRFAGTEVNRQRGLWLVAHVHTVLGDAAQAMKYAQACLELTNEYEDRMQDFDIAYAQEGISRAMALAGDYDAARDHMAMAQEAGDRILGPEDKSIFMGDFETGNWHGVK